MKTDSIAPAKPATAELGCNPTVLENEIIEAAHLASIVTEMFEDKIYENALKERNEGDLLVTIRLSFDGVDNLMYLMSKLYSVVRDLDDKASALIAEYCEQEVAAARASGRLAA